MSFESALQAATEMAAEYTTLNAQIGGMACAADHDPRWSETDEQRLGEAYKREAELEKQIATAIAEIERDHRDAWRDYLVVSTTRLGEIQRDGRRGQYELDCWTRWLHGTRPDNPGVIFARGVAVLAGR